MVFHKELAADSECEIKMTRRRLVLTKVVLEQRFFRFDTFAVLLIKQKDGIWTPLEFMDSEKNQSGTLNLTVEPGETICLKCAGDECWRRPLNLSSVGVSSASSLHLYGNIEEVEEGAGSEVQSCFAFRNIMDPRAMSITQLHQCAEQLGACDKQLSDAREMSLDSPDPKEAYSLLIDELKAAIPQAQTGRPPSGKKIAEAWRLLNPVNALGPPAKRARHGAPDDEVFQQGRAETLRQ